MRLLPSVSRLNVLLACIVLVCLTQVVSAEELSAAAQRLQDDVKYLASEELEGRGIGTDGLEKAAEYVAKSFQESGLNVTIAGGDPYQEFEITDGAKLGKKNAISFVGPNGETISLNIDDQFKVCAFGGSGNFNSPVVFAGYGIQAEDAGYNDFSTIDVKDKVVIMMRRNPQQANPHGSFAVGHGISRHAALTTKLSRAYSNGAKAVIFVNDPYTDRAEREELELQVKNAETKLAEIQKDAGGDAAAIKTAETHLEEVKNILAELKTDALMEFGYGGTREGTSPPTFQISQEVCNQLLQASLGKTLDEIEAEIDRSGQPYSRYLSGWNAVGEAELNVVKVPVKNVIGVLEGEGPLKNETIVIGAHIDHLGFGGEGSLLPHSKEIHNGADDNASGTAGLLELARRFGKRTEPLPRRLVFIGFTGEERGLLGSEEYVKDPLYPLANTVAMFNMDMIGRMEEDKLTVFGVGTSEVWEPLLDQLADPLGIKLSKKIEGFGPSDHSSFYAKRIPVLHLFTGTHSDYHRPSDDWEKVIPQDMQRIVDLLEQVVITTTETEAKPGYVHIEGKATLERSGRRPYFGSIPDFGSDAAGYAIQGVAPNSPAEKGGIQGGDVIIKLGTQKVGGLDDFDLALRDFAPGDQADVVVLRDGKEVALKVTLSSPRN